MACSTGHKGTHGVQKEGRTSGNAPEPPYVTFPQERSTSVRTSVVSFALAALSVLGFAAPASASSPSCLKNPVACANAAVCEVGQAVGLQCVDR